MDLGLSSPRKHTNNSLWHEACYHRAAHIDLPELAFGFFGTDTRDGEVFNQHATAGPDAETESGHGRRKGWGRRFTHCLVPSRPKT